MTRFHQNCHLLLLVVVVVLATALSTVAAFCPAHVSQQQRMLQQQQQQQQQRQPFSTTRLHESIIEAEDRYLNQASQAMGVMERPEVVYTIVYNPGTPEEGIHTVKYPRGTESDVLLLFEGMADCIVFARTITEDPSMDQTPIPTPTSLEMIEQACQGMGVQTAFVPMEQKTEW